MNPFVSGEAALLFDYNTAFTSLSVQYDCESPAMTEHLFVTQRDQYSRVRRYSSYYGLTLKTETMVHPRSRGKGCEGHKSVLLN